MKPDSPLDAIESVTTSDKRLSAHDNREGRTNRGPDMTIETADERRQRYQRQVGATPEERSEHMRAIARKNTGPRKTRSTPAQIRRTLQEIDELEPNELLLKGREMLLAELEAARLTPSQTLIEMAVRQWAILEAVDGMLFREAGGPVHRRKRELHHYIEQRKELQAVWLSLRQKMGLDQEPVPFPSAEAVPSAYAARPQAYADDDEGHFLARRMAFALAKGLQRQAVTQTTEPQETSQ